MRKFSLLEGFFDPKVLLLALNYFGIVAASLGILFFVPQIIQSIGVTDNMTAVVCALFLDIPNPAGSAKPGEPRPVPAE